MNQKFSLIFLCGGTGQRLQSQIPKQYLTLNKKPVFLHSLETFQKNPDIFEIIVVCGKEYQHLFQGDFVFASPGKTRQDSVYNGFKKITSTDFVIIHDGARPNIKETDLLNLMKNTKNYQALTLGIPVTSTIKESDTNNIVKKLTQFSTNIVNKFITLLPTYLG